MKRRFRVTPRAHADLHAIARYTHKTWGAAQSAKYLRALDRRFHILADNPHLGRARPEIAEGYYSARQGSHLIFYLIGDEAIDIIGVPHFAQDIERYFE